MLDKAVDTSELESVMKKACALVEKSAKEKAPKDTGALRRSISSKVNSSGDGVEGIIYSNSEYAPYVEYGTGLFAEAGDGRKDVPWVYESGGEFYRTSGQKPQPFMRPALNENREEILRTIKKGLSQ